jgi:hypothetical protein
VPRVGPLPAPSALLRIKVPFRIAARVEGHKEVKDRPIGDVDQMRAAAITQRKCFGSRRSHPVLQRQGLRRLPKEMVLKADIPAAWELFARITSIVRRWSRSAVKSFLPLPPLGLAEVLHCTRSKERASCNIAFREERTSPLFVFPKCGLRVQCIRALRTSGDSCRTSAQKKTGSQRRPKTVLGFQSWEAIAKIGRTPRNRGPANSPHSCKVCLPTCRLSPPDSCRQE